MTWVEISEALSVTEVQDQHTLLERASQLTWHKAKSFIVYVVHDQSTRSSDSYSNQAYNLRPQTGFKYFKEQFTHSDNVPSTVLWWSALEIQLLINSCWIGLSHDVYFFAQSLTWPPITHTLVLTLFENITLTSTLSKTKPKPQPLHLSFLSHLKFNLNTYQSTNLAQHQARSRFINPIDPYYNGHC